MTRAIIILLALVATLEAQRVYWTEQIPKLARAGQTVRLRYRTDGVTRMVFEPMGGQPRDFAAAGANQFEIEFTAPPIEARHLFQRTVGIARLFTLAGAAPGFAQVAIRYADGLPPVRITPLAADAQRSDYILNLHAPSYYANLIGRDGNIFFERENHAQRMYAFVPDDFDFVNIVTGTLGVVENRHHGVIRNAVQGLGMQLFDTGGRWGSARRLMGFSMFPNAAIFDGADSGYTHETGHQWVNFSREPFRITGAHWPISSMATGTMGWNSRLNGQGLSFPCVFQPQADGTIRVTASGGARPFNDFDLYLMGLLEPGEVEQQYLVTDAAKEAAAQTQSCGGLGTLTPDQYRVVTVQELITANGPRVPPVSAAQKNFRSIHLVLSRDGLLSAEEMAYFEYMARRSEERGAVPYNTGAAAGFAAPWFASTRGRSVLTSRLSADPLPTITYGGVVNAASFRGSDLGPGAVASIFGSDLAGATASATAVPLPTTLGGIRVIVNGRPAPLFFVSPGQINFQLPSGLSTAPIAPGDPAYLASVHIERGGAASNAAFVEIRAGAPGIITYGDGLAVATLPDGSVVGPGNPAVAGRPVTVYWVGAAPLTESVPEGTPAPAERLIRVTGPASATLSGSAQTIAFLGVTPGGVGLYQANLLLSISLEAGDHPLLLTIGGRASNTARLSVRRPD